MWGGGKEGWGGLGGPARGDIAAQQHENSQASLAPSPGTHVMTARPGRAHDEAAAEGAGGDARAHRVHKNDGLRSTRPTPNAAGGGGQSVADNRHWRCMCYRGHCPRHLEQPIDVGLARQVFAPGGSVNKRGARFARAVVSMLQTQDGNLVLPSPPPGSVEERGRNPRAYDC